MLPMTPEGLMWERVAAPGAGLMPPLVRCLLQLEGRVSRMELSMRKVTQISVSLGEKQVFLDVSFVAQFAANMHNMLPTMVQEMCLALLLQSPDPDRWAWTVEALQILVEEDCAYLHALTSPALAHYYGGWTPDREAAVRGSRLLQLLDGVEPEMWTAMRHDKELCARVVQVLNTPVDPAPVPLPKLTGGSHEGA